MAFPWADLVDEVMAIVAATWPETIENGIYRFEDLQRISWEVPEGYPYATVTIRGMGPGDWGIANRAVEPVLQIDYITAETEAQEADPVAALNVIADKLEALKVALDDGAYATSQATVIDIEELDFSGASAVNALLAAKNVPTRGGMLALRYTCGTGPA